MFLFFGRLFSPRRLHGVPFVLDKGAVAVCHFLGLVVGVLFFHVQEPARIITNTKIVLTLHRIRRATNRNGRHAAHLHLLG